MAVSQVLLAFTMCHQMHPRATAPQAVGKALAVLLALAALKAHLVDMVIVKGVHVQAKIAVVAAARKGAANLEVKQHRRLLKLEAAVTPVVAPVVKVAQLGAGGRRKITKKQGFAS